MELLTKENKEQFKKLFTNKYKIKTVKKTRAKNPNPIDEFIGYSDMYKAVVRYWWFPFGWFGCKDSWMGGYCRATKERARYDIDKRRIQTSLFKSKRLNK